MTEEIPNSSPEPVAAPLVVSPAIEAVPSPAVEAPTTETPNVEAPAEIVTEAKVETPAPDTLLGGDKKTGEEKSVEGEEKPSEKTQSEEKAPEEVTLPEYEAFTLPEGVTLEADKLGEFTKELAEFEVKTKASHEEVQALGQKMVDKYIAEQQRYIQSLTQAWEKQKTDWKDSFLKDPEFTNRTNTVLNSAIDAINIYAGDAKQQDEFRGLMESSGIGNHPAMIRLLSNIMLAKAEPRPLAAPQIASTVKGSKIERMYGAKK